MRVTCPSEQKDHNFHVHANQNHRIVIGLIVLVAVVVAGFAVAMPALTRWGATDEEVARPSPGDATLPDPLVDWTTAITINAPPDQVWPWIAQIGDTRGGFYSYTFAA